MIVAYDSSDRGPMLVASSETGSDVIATDDGSADLFSTAGVHSEQNMLRVASWAPSLRRTAATGAAAVGITAVVLDACSGSPRYLASTMWLVALAANTAQTTTTTPP